MSFFKGWIKQYKSMPQTVRASILFTICGLLQKGVSIIAIPIYTRIMSTEEYGQYTVYYSWYGILTIFTTLNMWNYLINNGMTEFENSQADFISSLQGLSGLITIGWILVYLLLQYN